jgi:electron transfer flavoprotein alpha subunit
VAGSEEAIAEAGGVAVVAGDGAAEAAAELAERASILHAGDECRELRVLELGGSFRPSEWARAIASHVEPDDVVVLPASPDGRDLAPRLAVALGRPLLAGAIKVTAEGASLVWRQGRQVARFRTGGPFVATLLPGSRSARLTLGGDWDLGSPGLGSGALSSGNGSASSGNGSASSGNGSASSGSGSASSGSGSASSGSGAARSGSGAASRPSVVTLVVLLEAETAADPELLEVMAADPAAMDLAEAQRIVAAGAGLGSPEKLALLEIVAAQLGASLGATRVVTDAGWLAHERQIGTTGVSVRPRCYVAFGISGAAQHVGGLGAPRHVVSVNLDPSCPMMAMADLALVTDAGALVEVLARRLTATAAQEADS